MVIVCLPSLKFHGCCYAKNIELLPWPPVHHHLSGLIDNSNYWIGNGQTKTKNPYKMEFTLSLLYSISVFALTLIRFLSHPLVICGIHKEQVKLVSFCYFSIPLRAFHISVYSCVTEKYL